MENDKVRRDQAQIFPCEFPVRCQVFCCEKNMGSWYIGRPDGPLNLCLVICDNCLKTILKSASDKLVEEVFADKIVLKEKGYPCQYCKEVFKNPQALAVHIRHKCGPDRQGEQGEKNE